MEVSEQLTGAHTTASPSGQLVASIATTGKLRIYASYAPERSTEINIRVPPKDVTALRWNKDSDRVAVLSHRLIEIVDLHNDSHRIRLDNGSGGLGKFASADFVGDDQLLVIWEFGKAKVWNLSNGKSVDLADVKTTCTGSNRQLRPQASNAATAEPTQTLAILSRDGAGDMLQLYLPALQKTIAASKLPTTDAQSLSWSSDGRWLAVLDTPTASHSVHFFTPDGHLFRSYPPARDASHSGLGIKSVSWAGNSQFIALARFDGKIVLLNTRTFTPLAIIEHHALIDQLPEQQAPIWQEVVSTASIGERSYTAVSQPFSPPLSKTRPSAEPSELGVAEACFSCDGAYLATRDERMLNTVWIWEMAGLGAHAVVVQHSNVRRMAWHPSRAETILLDCGESIGYLLNASSPYEPPLAYLGSLSGSPVLSWLPAPAASPLSIILSATKSSFQLLYPEGRPELHSAETADNASPAKLANEHDNDDGDVGDDSLLDMLAGRTPLPPQSYTERIDMEVETEERDGTTVRMDDTFQGKRIFSRGAGGRGGDKGDEGGDGVNGGYGRLTATRDPLDDSQIF